LSNQYQTPSQSSFANAVHCYTQKLAVNRPRSASTGGQRPGTCLSFEITSEKSHDRVVSLASLMERRTFVL
jgi:hypothetical protein